MSSALTAEAPANEFEYIHHSAPVVWENVIGLVLLAALWLAIILLTVRFHIGSKTFSASMRAAYTDFRLRQIKLCSVLALLVGALLATLDAYRALVQAAIYGLSFDAVFGPLAEALIYLMIGLIVAASGTVCSMIVLGRGKNLTD